MATYFHGNSDIQGADGLQTLVLMNPGYGGYSTTQLQPPQLSSQPGNYFFFNPAAADNATNLSHAPPSQTPQFIGIPFQAATSPQDFSALHGFLPRAQYNMFNPVEFTAAREIANPQQGLSLSLSSQQPDQGSFRRERPTQQQHPSPVISRSSQDDVRVSGGSSSTASGTSNRINGMQSVLLNSKYLKATRELLDEVVNVGGIAIKDAESGKNIDGQPKTVGDSSVTGTTIGGDTELNTAERQEIHTKKARLVNMLDQVEQRYRHYQHQMQIVISWFEQATGIGTAKTYTGVALQAISKQFRCLKEAIIGQIRAASKSLGEEECLGGRIEGSRLKFVGNQIRQSKALQQLGPIQNNAWRPQRGLPERSVTVLRAWLFEHFLHPYPKDSDKIMLAKQAGLTRSQVSNWFINARVRLWKPMVEEMYMVEMKTHDPNGSHDKTNNGEQNVDSASKSSETEEKFLGSENQNSSFKQGSNSTTGQKMEKITQGNPTKIRSTEILHSPNSLQSGHREWDDKPVESSNEQNFRKFGNKRQQNREGFTSMGGSASSIGGLGSYPMEEIRTFGSDQFPAPYSVNCVSLTLGLQNCGNTPTSMSGTHQTFIPNQNIHPGRGLEVRERNEFTAPVSSHPTNVYESINIRNPKGLAAQLLTNFVG